jgi:hypothetical protein
MRNSKKIIISSCCIELFFIVSVRAFGDMPPSMWDLVRQEMTKKAEPNKPAESAKSAASVKPVVVVETAKSLLDKCTETLDKTHTSFITQSKCHRNSDYKTGNREQDGLKNDYFLTEFRTDSKRLKRITQKWGDWYGSFQPESERQYSAGVYDGNVVYSHVRPYNSSGRVSVHTKDLGLETNINIRLAYENPISQCFGFLIGDVERFDRIIKKDGIGPISVREEEYKDTKHYVIEANTTHGQYQIWLNPEKGYNFSKATVTRKSGDAFLFNSKVTDGQVKNYLIEVEEFKQVDNLWVPVKAKARENDTLPNNCYKKLDWELELTKISINRTMML